jgi:hypothetical protein
VAIDHPMWNRSALSLADRADHAPSEQRVIESSHLAAELSRR